MLGAGVTARVEGSDSVVQQRWPSGASRYTNRSAMTSNDGTEGASEGGREAGLLLALFCGVLATAFGCKITLYIMPAPVCARDNLAKGFFSSMTGVSSGARLIGRSEV